jgi:hypothetical protein
MGGGGGSSGAVSWPTYLCDRHSNIIDKVNFNIIDRTEMFESEIRGLQAYNAAEQEGFIADAAVSFGTTVGSINPLMWADYVDIAMAKYLTVLGTDPIMDTPVPVAVATIMANWESLTLEAAANIGSNWSNPSNEAATLIGTGWSHPSPDAATDIMANLANDAEINNSVNEFRNVLSDQLTAEILPRFEAGMRDINAVMSSAFVLGRSVIEGMASRDVAKFQADLRFKAFLQRDELLSRAYLQDDQIEAGDLDGENKATAEAFLSYDKINAGSIEGLNKSLASAFVNEDTLNAGNVGDRNKAISSAAITIDNIQAEDIKSKNLIAAEMARHKTSLSFQGADKLLQSSLAVYELYKAVASLHIEANRIVYVMRKEEQDKNNDIQMIGINNYEHTFQTGANVLASVSGGTSLAQTPSTTQSVLGGALAGASIGAKISDTAFGAGTGAVLGGIGALLLGNR